MEGPYLAEVGPIRGATVHLELVEAGLSRRVTHSLDVDLASLATTLVAAAEESLFECRRRAWWSNDEKDLDDSLAQLKHLLKRH